MGAIEWCYNDGGRSDAGYKGEADDCVVRAIAIATQKPYKEVYKALFSLSGESPRGGVKKRFYVKYLNSIGWEWLPLMGIGTGCQVHLNAEELPSKGHYILSVSKHLCTVIDGVLHDTHDCSRDGKRCVYGYFQAKKGGKKC